MPFSLRRLATALCMLVLCGLSGTSQASQPSASTENLLRQVRQAYGGDHWADEGALQARGIEISEGMQGPLHAMVDLATGHHVVHADNHLFNTARGCDAGGCWHLGVSGIVHAYDSAEAMRTAVTRQWLARFGFLHTPDDMTIYRHLPSVREDGHGFLRLQAIPAGGQAVTLWIDPATYRVKRAIWRESFVIVNQRYADYRRVDGLWLPFRIATVSHTLTGGTDIDREDTIKRYQVLDRTPAKSLQRPDRTVRDVAMPDGTDRAVSPMRLNGGALLVEARINGGEPMWFILDTGGHAILTADAANKLGLASHGQGSSTGSGPGAMRTAYTKVKRLSIGKADIRDKTFLVMPYPYSFYERGPRRPIAGILGLEIFQRFAVTFDYDHHQLVLEPFDHGDPPPPGKGTPVPLSFTYDMPLVDAELEGRHGVFGIDTGNSSYTLVFPNWASRESLFPRYAKGAPIPTGGVGGEYIAHLSHARSMRLGDARVTGLNVMLTRADAGATGNPSEAGNIGQDVLSRFNVHIDYRQRRMYLAPRTKPHEVHFAAAGLSVTKHEARPDRFVVNWVLDGGPAAQAGLKQGDAITAVNDAPVTTLGSRDFRELARGQPAGTHLRLTCADGRHLDLLLHELGPNNKGDTNTRDGGN